MRFLLMGVGFGLGGYFALRSGTGWAFGFRVFGRGFRVLGRGFAMSDKRSGAFDQWVPFLDFGSCLVGFNFRVWHGAGIEVRKGS